MSKQEFEPLTRSSILNTVTLRGSDIEQVFNGIRHANLATLGDLRVMYAAHTFDSWNDNLLRDALDFLRLISLVGRRASTKGDPESADFVKLVEQSDESLPFRLLLLASLKRQGNDKNAFAAVQRHIVGKDLVETSIENIRIDFETLSNNEHNINEEKLSFWVNLATYIGLVQRITTNPRSRPTLLCTPSVELVTDILVAYQAQHNSNTIPLAPWIAFVEGRFFRCRTDIGSIHQGLAQSLLALPLCQLASLETSADDPDTVDLGSRKVSRITMR